MRRSEVVSAKASHTACDAIAGRRVFSDHIPMSLHQHELLGSLSSPIESGIIKVLHPDSGFFRRFETAFRFEGSKIRWDLVNGHVSLTHGQTDFGVFRRFFSERSRELDRDRTAIYLNDDLVKCGLSASLFAFERHLNDIISIPAHHYFVADDLAWCMAYTLEGDIDFGWSVLQSL